MKANTTQCNRSQRCLSFAAPFSCFRRHISLSLPSKPEHDPSEPSVTAKYKYIVQSTARRTRVVKRKRCRWTSAEQLKSFCTNFLKVGEENAVWGRLWGEDNTLSRPIVEQSTNACLQSCILCHPIRFNLDFWTKMQLKIRKHLGFSASASWCSSFRLEFFSKPQHALGHSKMGLHILTRLDHT